jgi:hypothetical protein
VAVVAVDKTMADQQQAQVVAVRVEQLQMLLLELQIQAVAVEEALLALKQVATVVQV